MPLFEKGNKLAVGRQGKVPEALKDCTSTEIRAVIWRLWKMEPDQLQGFIKRPNSTVGELAIASVIAKAIKMGDPNRLEFLLNRLVGRVKEVVEIDANVNMTNQPMTHADALKILTVDYAVVAPTEQIEILDI